MRALCPNWIANVHATRVNNSWATAAVVSRSTLYARRSARAAARQLYRRTVVIYDYQRDVIVPEPGRKIVLSRRAPPRFRPSKELVKTHENAVLISGRSSFQNARSNRRHTQKGGSDNPAFSAFRPCRPSSKGDLQKRFCCTYICSCLDWRAGVNSSRPS